MSPVNFSAFSSPARATPQRTQLPGDKYRPWHNRTEIQQIPSASPRIRSDTLKIVSAGQFNQSARSSAATADSFGQSAGAFGQSSKSFGQSASPFGVPADSFGVAAGAFGLSAEAFDATAGFFGPSDCLFLTSFSPFVVFSVHIGFPFDRFGLAAFDDFLLFAAIAIARCAHAVSSGAFSSTSGGTS